MRILIAHNFYQQAGGEDRVFRAEADLLEERGHDVLRYSVHNNAINERARLSLSIGAIWSRSAYRDLQKAIRAFRPDVVHIHNTLPLLSPAVYYAAKRIGIPVVQTLHNFRLICPNALLYRDGRPCEECVGRSFALPAVVHRCYRGDRAASAVVAGIIGVHRAMGTWRNEVDTYIAVSRLGREKFIEGGIPAERIEIKPNFVHPDPSIGNHDGDYALFVGRLSPEKGVDVLVRAWERTEQSLPLKLAGGGPLLRLGDNTRADIEWLGEQTSAEVMSLMRNARFLVFPSKCYEGFPVTLVEAFATGLPVIASDTGGMAEIIEHGVNGLLFPSGDEAALAALTDWAIANPEKMVRLGAAARRDFETTYNAAANYSRLIGIYERAIARASATDDGNAEQLATSSTHSR